jgi:hypothetical protein
MSIEFMANSWRIHGVDDRFQFLPIGLWQTSPVIADDSDRQLLHFPPLTRGGGGIFQVGFV